MIAPGEVIYCPQRTDDPPEQLAEFIAATGRAGLRAPRATAASRPTGPARWQTLSHGERKRAQIAVALWRQPDVLAIDEPTNHIDRAARRAAGGGTAGYRGVGLLVSHDRELLDMLCSRCLFLEPHAAVMRPGGYSKAVEQARADAERARTVYRQTKREVKQLEREEADRRHEAAQADGKRSKRKLDLRDKDGRAKIDLARVSGKDGAAGRKQSQMQGRLQQAQESLAGLHVPRKQSLGITLRGEAPAQQRAGPAGRRDRTGRRADAAAPGAADRTGRPHRAGRSQRRRQEHADPAHPRASVACRRERVVYMPQEIERAEAARILAAVRALPDEQLGDVMTVVSCLGSDAAAGAGDG